jgi:hypothetical protein
MLLLTGWAASRGGHTPRNSATKVVKAETKSGCTMVTEEGNAANGWKHHAIAVCAFNSATKARHNA